MYLFLLTLVFLTSYIHSITIGQGKVIDLTWPFDNKSIYWPGHTEFHFTKQTGALRDGYWYSSNEFSASEHGGTHLDAPYHFKQDGWKLGEIPAERFIAEGVLIDLSKEVDKVGSTRNLEDFDLVNWEKKHGELPNHCLVLVRFGWSKYYSDKDTYLGKNSENESELNFPGISPGAATWLTSNDKIVGVGVDVASVDPGNSSKYHAHRSFADANIYTLENVKLINKLPVRNFVVVALPMYIKEGSGAPVRIVAILPNV